MVHIILHFYLNTFHIWTGWGGINFVWPKEHSMQSEFPWLQLNAAPMPCALDQAVVVHDPLHRWVSCFTVAFNDGRRCVCPGGRSLWRQISNDVGQHVSTSMVLGRMLLCVIHGSLTDLRCRDEIVCSLIHPALQAMGPCATLCRTPLPLLTELRSSQISCHPLPKVGSCQSLDKE